MNKFEIINIISMNNLNQSKKIICDFNKLYMFYLNVLKLK